MRKMAGLIGLLLTFACFLAPISGFAADEGPKPDPSGAGIGSKSDIMDILKEDADKELKPDELKAALDKRLEEMTEKEPLAAKLMDVVGHNKVSINHVWLLICGFLVMFMQAGFALAETGFCRAKNAGHTMAMNFMVYGLGMLGYWATGFAIQMGGSGPWLALGAGATMDGIYSIELMGKTFDLFGTKGFFLTGDAYDSGVMAMFLFQMVFMDTTATIPTGSMAERWNFKSFFIYAFFISGLVYPLYANWVWGGGWLADLGANFELGHGAVDFAGSSVVHMTGGVAALAGAIVLGPRLGKFRPDGTPVAIPGHHIPMAVAGCLILAFGWFGFNAGSTFAGTDLRIGAIATNTMLASAAGATVAALYMWAVYGKPDISMAANGLLAALVGITAPCAFVTPLAAVGIGAVAGLLLCWSVFFVERVLKIDDPVGAISVHGVNGAWGMIALGLFADGSYGDGWNGVSGTVTGLMYGDASQLMAQLVAVGTNIVFVFVVMFVFFKIVDAVIGLRVPAEVELEGADMSEVAVIAYPDFNLKQTHR